MENTSSPKRVSIFVDGANMLYTQKQGLGWFFDPAKLLEVLTEDNELADAFWYMSVRQPVAPRDLQFIRFLSAVGYTIRIKTSRIPLENRNTDAVRRANLEIELVADMFNTVDCYDKAILLSGDGDFERALELLRARGKQITVVSTENWIGAELRQSAGSHFIDLKSLRSRIERPFHGSASVENVVQERTPEYAEG